MVRLAEGDLVEAARLGSAAVEHAHASAGLGDDFMQFWSPAVRAALEAGDVDEAERLFAVVADSPPGLILPVLAAELPRLRALIAVARGGDPDAIESDLRSSVDALDSYGARPAAARTREDLAAWLVGQGRSEEAEELLGVVRETYQELGAVGWLAALAQRQRVEA